MIETEYPLTYKRDTLITVLQERLAEREKQREDERKAAADRNKKVRDQIVELLDKYPQFLIGLAGFMEDRWQGGRPGSDTFAEYIRNQYAPAEERGGTAPRDPDENIKRLIRVYEKAEDTEVKVQVTDEVFSYL